MATAGKAKMAVNDASLIGWKPRKWEKNGRSLYYHGNGRRKPKGKRCTISMVRVRRKARNAGKRRSA